MSFSQSHKNNLISALPAAESQAVATFRKELIILCDKLITEENEENWQMLFSHFKLHSLLPKEKKSFLMMELQKAYADFHAGSDAQYTSIFSTSTPRFTPLTETFSTLSLTSSTDLNDYTEDEEYIEPKTSRQIIELKNDSSALHKPRFFQGVENAPAEQKHYARNQWQNS